MNIKFYKNKNPKSLLRRNLGYVCCHKFDRVGSRLAQFNNFNRGMSACGSV